MCIQVKNYTEKIQEKNENYIDLKNPILVNNILFT